MAKRGKNYERVAALVDKSKQLSIEEAVNLLKQIHFAKFDETVNLDFRLTVDPRQADQQVRGTVALPHGTGKKIRVAVFAKGDKLREAEESGADVAGAEDLVKRVLDGFLDFDAAISTPDMMREVGKLGKVLGPRGLMPNPKTNTVTMDIRGAINAIKAGRVEYRLDRNANIHVAVGKISFTPQQLADNVRAVVDAVVKAKPASIKGLYIKSLTLHGTMTPGIRLLPQA